MSPSLQVVFCTAHGFFSTEPPGQPKQTWQHLFSFLMATFKHVSFDMCMTVCVFGASLVAQRLKCVLGNLYEINGPICRKKPSYKAANDFWWYLSPKSQLYLSSFSYFSSIPVIHFKIVYSFVIFSCNFIHFKNTLFPFPVKKKKIVWKCRKLLACFTLCFFVVVGKYSCGCSHNIIYLLTLSQWDSTFWQPLK